MGPPLALVPYLSLLFIVKGQALSAALIGIKVLSLWMVFTSASLLYISPPSRDTGKTLSFPVAQC